MVSTESIEVSENVEKLIIVSDLHGLVEPLETMDDILGQISENVQVVAAGDYFVNGPCPAEVLDWVRANAGDYAILGNHDEAAIASTGDNLALYTESGAFSCLDAGQRDYLTNLPNILELSWRGARIRIAHHFTPCGEILSYKARVGETFEMFADSTVDLTVCAHTHYPFLCERDGAWVANTGALNHLVVGHMRSDGGIDPKGEDEVVKPLTEMYSTYLSIVAPDGVLQPTIERFTYDMDKALGRLEKMEHPNLENVSTMFRTGICWV